jgi:hypothetical protein
MAKDDRIEFKVSSEEKAQMEDTANETDYDSVSAYLRALHRANRRKLDQKKK